MLRVELLDHHVHRRDAFSCGEPSLDQYLRQFPVQHQQAGVSTTHVLVKTDAPATVLGYYSLSAAQVMLSDLQPSDRKRFPKYPVPAVRMGRSAVARQAQGAGFGEYLVGDAVARCLGLRPALGVRVLVVDALHDRAAAFYLSYGFRPTAYGALTLYLPLGVR